MPSAEPEDRSIRNHHLQSNSDNLIVAKCISKIFPLYKRPFDRLKQLAASKLAKLLNKKPKRYFEDYAALSNVSFVVKRGQSIGVIGRNGAGKSTLLQLITGTLNPTSGSVYVNGRVAALLELGSGFNPEFTGRENIHMNARIYKLTDSQIKQCYSDIVSFADIGDFIDQPVKTYSSGMTLRLAFAVIAHVNADILIIDEALAVGDVFFTQKCMRFLHEFMKNGTLLFVSHDTSAVQALCDHVIWLDRGKVVAAGLPKDVTERYLEALFASRQDSHLQEPRLDSHLQATSDREYGSRDSTLDQRQALINSSTLRNDIQVFHFNQNARSFGKRDAKITNVTLCNKDGTHLSWCVGGENVSLVIEAIALSDLQSVIIGFHVKDSLGQTLFGDNTFLSYEKTPVHAINGEELKAKFVFQMPRMPVGEYTISSAIATGTQNEHTHQHWIHDAISFRSVISSTATGLIGIPMYLIEIAKETKSNA